VFDTPAADRGKTYLMIDSAIARAHRQAADRKGRTGTKDRGALEVDQPKIHMLADTLGRPVRFRVTPG
jgi:hypothetical protein